MRACNEEFAAAAADYRWLLDRGYPVAASIKLVGDRRRLDKTERLVLFRGVADAASSARRRSLLAAPPRGGELLVDGYNQLFAAAHYLDGRLLFISSDGFLRDAGAAHGRIAREETFRRAMELLADGIAAAGPSRAAVRFDSPVSGSAVHARDFASVLRDRGVEAECFLDRSADFPLKAAPPGSAVATSDSAVIDALLARGGVALFDAARFALELAFGERNWLDLEETEQRLWYSE